jgi:hypothetical protein
VAGLGDLVEHFRHVELSLGVDELLGKRPEWESNKVGGKSGSETY